jgi:hypothetical protein
MTRSEHLAWCKERAMEYYNQGDLANAVASMTSDLNNHDETRCNNPFLIQLGMMELMNNNREGVRRWIEGFN